MLNNCISLIFSAIATKFRLIVGYVISLFNKYHYAIYGQEAFNICHPYMTDIQ